MLLESEGGIYGDLETAAPKPAAEWIPSRLRSTVRAVVGIEYERDGDRGEGDAHAAAAGMEEAEEEEDEGVQRLRFSQGTMAASRGHPLMTRLINDMVGGLQVLALMNETAVAEMRFRGGEVGELSGSGVWTRAILETLSEATGTEVGIRNVTGMKEPRLFGDVLVLPVNGFKTGQLRSGGGREGAGDGFGRQGWGERSKYG